MTAHGQRGTYVGGCRCDDCREANRRYHEARRRAAGVRPVEASKHGTVNRYIKYRCRCDDCRAANTGMVRTSRARRRERTGRDRA